jgi:putative membrane protein
MAAGAHIYGEKPVWSPTRPRLGVLHLLGSWVLSTIALVVGTAVIPGAAVNDVWGAFAAAAVIGILNALLPPIVAALRLPLMALVGFLLVLVLDAAMLLAADAITGGDLHVDGFWAALGVALVAAAAGLALGVLFGVDDDDSTRCA